MSTVLFADAWVWQMFAFGTFWFWLLLAGLTVALFYCAENDSGVCATLAVVGGLCALQFFGQVNVFGWVVHNPITMCLYIAGYIVAGAAWMLVKWWSFNRDQRHHYDDAKEEFLRSRNLAGFLVPDNLKKEFESHITTLTKYHHKFEVRPQISEHKSRAYIWMVYWPWSLTWTAINDPIRRIFREVYRTMRGWMVAITDRMWRDISVDFPVPAPKE